VKGTTATEFATIDLDQMLADAEEETTPAPNAESAAFGGLDIGGMVGGYLGGFAAPIENKDKPAETTPAPNDEKLTFGGLDIGGLVGGNLGGFVAPAANKDKPAETGGIFG
jgi:predicted lipid-binding transport protein (Tim44 family)